VASNVFTFVSVPEWPIYATAADLTAHTWGAEKIWPGEGERNRRLKMLCNKELHSMHASCSKPD
jgi:hypothetical protein